ncbi:C40 family peptidase [Yoonia sp. 208BN28-4]|uniref:C40 family peptidase n=1 Tax=Yoonia sp. 208BN28-4 TaxID=3126505 RepID=UPI0030A22CB4
MSDRRLTPANGRVAALHLQGHVAADAFVAGEKCNVQTAVADLCASPNGSRDRQLLMGAAVTVFEDRNGWSFLQTEADGYVGYLRSDALGPRTVPSHFVSTPATHVYESEAFKSRDLMVLSFGSKLTVTDERAKFFETPYGYVPKKHLRPLERPFADPVTIAQLFFGVPYLWGGNSVRGIDCSGLVQAALMSCGIYCPADSDMQRAETGALLDDGARLARGDLMFWKGHVGMMVDEDVMIHANAHHMAVVYEPIKDAIIRIKAQGDGDVLARKRL